MTIHTSIHAQYLAGPLGVDLHLGIVHRGAESVRFSPVELKVLSHLISHQGELVSRAQLFDAVWPNQQVNDDVLTRAISDIRTSLSKLDDGKYIETLPRRGYRWIVPLVSVASASEIVATQATEKPMNDPLPDISPSGPGSLSIKWSRSRFTVVVLGIALGSWLLACSMMWALSYSFLPGRVGLAVLPCVATSASAGAVAKLVDENLVAQLRQDQRFTLLSKAAIASRPAKPFPYFFSEFGTRWVLEAQVDDYDGTNTIELTLVDARTGIEVRSQHFSAATTAELSAQLARKLEWELLGDLIP